MKLKTLMGDHPVTRQFKTRTDKLDFVECSEAAPLFKRVVRNLEFDVAELAVVTHILAKAHGKPYRLLPFAVMARYQHPHLVYNAERGVVKPEDLSGKRVGVRSYSVTTGAWIRCVLAEDHGVDLSSIRWTTFEEPHVAEFRDPPNVQRAPAGKQIAAMLLAGELDAAILAPPPKDPRLKPVIADPDAAARDWYRRTRALQINHVVVVKQSLTKSDPEAVRELWRLLVESKRLGGPSEENGVDTRPYGVEANRRNLDVAIETAHRQGLIRRRFAVDELFDEVTRSFTAGV